MRQRLVLTTGTWALTRQASPHVSLSPRYVSCVRVCTIFMILLSLLFLALIAQLQFIFYLHAFCTLYHSSIRFILVLTVIFRSNCAFMRGFFFIFFFRFVKFFLSYLESITIVKYKVSRKNTHQNEIKPRIVVHETDHSACAIRLFQMSFWNSRKYV